MSYYNPKIYCKQNLKDDDRNELEYWNDVFMNIIESEQTEYYINNDGSILDKIQSEIITNFCEHLKIQLGYVMQDNLIARMDNYYCNEDEDEDSEDLKEVEDYETFLYDDRKEKNT